MPLLTARRPLIRAIGKSLVAAPSLSLAMARPASACHRIWEACFAGINRPVDPPPIVLDDLPYAGELYGCLVHCQTIGNTRFYKDRPVSIRFRAERSGILTSFLWNLRYNGISSQGKTETSYSTGDGGTVVVELRKNIPDGGPSKWWPDMTPSGLLAQTRYNNGQNIKLVGSDPFPIWNFINPVKITKGQIYHLVFHQLEADKAISVNLHSTNTPIAWGSTGGRAGPYYGDDSAHLWAQENYAVNGWFSRPHHIAFMEFYYSDGHATGVGEIYSSNSAQKPIGNGYLARERFTILDYTRTVTGVWFRLWYDGGAPANLNIRLETETRALIDQINISRTEVANTDLTSSPAPWVYKSLNKKQVLEKGKAYCLSFSCNNGLYQTSAILDGGSKGYRSRNRWVGALAEYSTDGGVTWKGWTIDKWSPEDYRDDMHLSVGFTVESVG